MRSGLLAFFLILTAPLVASAQFAGTADAVSGSPFTVSVSPTNPQPYGRATLSFLPGSADLTNATLSVTVGGKNVYEGNVQPVSVTLGSAGSETRAVAKVTAGGQSVAQTVSIIPQDVVLVVEPIASVPPLYKGKALVPQDGSVRVVAVANLRTSGGKQLDPSLLSYLWTIDGTKVASASGIGKSAVIVASPLQYRARDISVSVQSQDGSLSSGAATSLSSADPLVRVYENDPLLGIRFDRALSGAYSITGSESTLYGAPFSFPTSTGAPTLVWYLNGSTAQTGPSITLRPTGSGQGTASLSVVASGGSLGTATQNLSIIFGAQPTTNFFGL